MKIALLENLGVSKELIDQLAAPIKAQGHSFTYYDEKTTDIEELKRRSAGCDIVMIANNPYPAEVIMASSELKYLDVAFTGIDHVGLQACKEKGVLVSNAANYSNQTVAELVIGMAISLLRKLPQADTATRHGGNAAGLCGREIAGRTVGVIGTGRIGTITAKLFSAFGAKIIAYDPHPHAEAQAMGIRYTSLEELMTLSDIVTLHVPNNAETRGLINKQLLHRMKPTAVFINCARGPIVDNIALAEALRNGVLGGAAIDVYDMEPPIPQDYPLLQAPNTIFTPHIAFLSEESMIRRAEIVFDNLESYLRGEPKNVCKL